MSGKWHLGKRPGEWPARRGFDRSFVQSESDSAIVSAVITLGAGLGMKVVAEGVEDADQLEHELVENVWLTCEADEDLLFGQDHNAKWGMALAKIGVDPASLSVFSGTA